MNNIGYAVGSYVDSFGVTHGLLYNINGNTWQTIDDPNQSSVPAFDVTGTTINGINDLNQLVGFYSDGTNVNGFLATATPEPGSAALMTLASGLGVALAWVRRCRKRRNDL